MLCDVIYIDNTQQLVKKQMDDHLLYFKHLIKT